jgi:hypothetical protein
MGKSRATPTRRETARNLTLEGERTLRVQSPPCRGEKIHVSHLPAALVADEFGDVATATTSGGGC